MPAWGTLRRVCELSTISAYILLKPAELDDKMTPCLRILFFFWRDQHYLMFEASLGIDGSKGSVGTRTHFLTGAWSIGAILEGGRWISLRWSIYTRWNGWRPCDWWILMWFMPVTHAKTSHVNACNRSGAEKFHSPLQDRLQLDQASLENAGELDLRPSNTWRSST